MAMLSWSRSGEWRHPALPHALVRDVPLGRVLVVMSYGFEQQGQRPTTMCRAIEEAFEMTMIHQIRRDAELAAPCRASW